MAWYASPTLAYHETKKDKFTYYIGSDGSCTAATPTPPTPTPTKDTTCTTLLTGTDSTLTGWYDTDNEKFVI